MVFIQKIREKEKCIWFGLGLVILALSFLPFVLLGTDAPIPYHDQLDGEIIAYILRAKNLFSGSDAIPQFLGGMDKTALTPPAPLGVLLFCILPPFWAYLCLQITGQLAAFVGMYFLTRKMGVRAWLSVAVSLLYAFLPFLPVYGLTQYGLPLLFWCAWNLYENRHTGRSFLMVALYAAMSSFVLCGFGCLLLWAVLLCGIALQKKLRAHKCFAGGFFLMTGIYAVENFSLLQQIFGAEGESSSHKTEYVIAESGFFSQFSAYFLQNDEHSRDYHVWIVYIGIAVLLYCFFNRKRPGNLQKAYLQKGAGIFNVLICLYALAALWSSSIVVAIRSHLGAAGAFRAERLIWMAPVMWYLLLALGLEVLLGEGKRLVFLKVGMAGMGLAVLGTVVLKGSLIKPCVQKYLNAEYSAMTWTDYYADGVMEQVSAYILRTTGMTQEEYRVASLGIDPAAALYHGFYCLDGYSNNYALTYKYAFRTVIEKELQKSPYLQDYFDNWGNRCYLFAAEIPGYYNIEKGSFWYQNLELNTTALKELGCRYILSAAYIVNSEDMNLVLLREASFATEGSYYGIWLYEIIP